MFKILKIGRIGRMDKSASGEPIRNSRFEIGPGTGANATLLLGTHRPFLRSNLPNLAGQAAAHIVTLLDADETHALFLADSP